MLTREDFDLLIIVTVGSTSFQELIDRVVKVDFLESINRLQSTSSKLANNHVDPNERRMKKSCKVKLIIQVGNSVLNLSDPIIKASQLLPGEDRHEHEKNQSFQVAIDKFNSNYLDHLRYMYLGNKDHSSGSVMGPIEVMIFRFSNSMDLLLSVGDLIITHAGAGSILSSIKPINLQCPSSNPEDEGNIPEIKLTQDLNLEINPISRQRSKETIIVPNYQLMDNHQIDLANEISSLGLAISCAADQLVTALKQVEEKMKAGFQSFNTSSSSLPLEKGTKITEDGVSNSIKFRNLVDRQMGYLSQD